MAEPTPPNGEAWAVVAAELGKGDIYGSGQWRIILAREAQVSDLY